MNKENLWDTWNTTERSNLYITRVPKEMKKGVQRLFKEIMTENFLNLEEILDIQAHEVTRSSQNFHPK